jgi:hypothetical protein
MANCGLNGEVLIEFKKVSLVSGVLLSRINASALQEYTYALGFSTCSTRYVMCVKTLTYPKKKKIIKGA